MLPSHSSWAGCLCHVPLHALSTFPDKWLLRPWDREPDDVWDSCRTPSLVEQGARILPKRRQEIHYPCCPARTNTLTGTHSHVLGRMLCTQALAQREILVPPPFTPCREIRSPLVLMSHTAAELPEEQVHSWAGCKGQALPGLFPVPPWWQEALCVCAGWQDKDSFQQEHTKERHPTVTRIWGKGPGCCIPFE